MQLNLINEDEESYARKITRAVKDNDGDWWVEYPDEWKCVTDRAVEDNIRDIERAYGLQDIS